MGQEERRESHRGLSEDGNCWPGFIFSFKIADKKEQRTLDRVTLPYFAHCLCLNCAGIKERIEIRIYDPELHVKYEIHPVPFLRLVLCNSRNYLYFIPSFLFILKLVFNYYYLFQQSNQRSPLTSLGKRAHMFLEVKKNLQASTCPTKGNLMEKKRSITALFILNIKLLER